MGTIGWMVHRDIDILVDLTYKYQYHPSSTSYLRD